MAGYEIEKAVKVMAMMPIIHAGAASCEAWANFDKVYADKLSRAKIDDEKLADAACTVGTVRAFAAQAGAAGIDHLHWG